MGRRSTLEHWESYWAGHESLDQVYSTDERLAREILAEVPIRGRRVLEIGAGSGRDSLVLVRAGAAGFVLDYSPASLEHIRRQARQQGLRIHLIRADALRMPLRDGSFDVVFHQGLLEHFRDPMPLLRESARVASPRGLLAVDVPQTFHYYTLAKKLLIALDRWFAGWETQFTPAQLERLVAATGLRLRRTYGDWMVPGLWYRALRAGVHKLGVRLPLRPRGPGPWERGWERLRDGMRRHRAGLYTCHVIGVLAEKP